METSRRDPLAGSFGLLFEVGTVAGMSDGELLDRFVARRSLGAEAAEVAFEALVRRHGPMILQVCRTRLGDEHDAQDAFQATFLILARKAASIRRRDSAASWLQGVARRVAASARRASAVRRAREREASRSNLEASPSPDAEPAELVPVVREEVGDLPEKYRTPLMLCLIDGLTHEEAATRLGWPVGTVKTRVRQAKDRLRIRLTRRGFAPTLGAIAAALTSREASALPMALIRTTARASLRYASGKAMTAGAASATVASLVELGIGSLLMSRIKLIALCIASFGAIAAGTAGYATTGTKQDQDKAEPKPRPVVSLDSKETPEPAKEVLFTGIDPADLLAEADLARIDLEMLEARVEAMKQEIMAATGNRRSYETTLDQIRRAETAEDLQKIGQYIGGKKDEFDSYKNNRVEYFVRSIETFEKDLKRLRPAYAELKRQLRREEQRIKTMEDLVAQADPSSRPDVGRGRDSAVNKKNPTAVDKDKLSRQIEEARLELDFALKQIDDSKNQLIFIMGLVKREEFRLEQLKAAKTLEDIEMVSGATPSNLEFSAAKEQVEKSIMDQYTQSKNRLVRDRAAYFQAIEQSKQAEQRVNDLEAQAARAESMPEPRASMPAPASPPDEVGRRLSDLERKLDLILKALEARPAAK